MPDYPDADNFTAPFFGKGNVLSNNYSNRTITGTLIPDTAAQSDRAATDKDFGKLQDIVAAELPVLPVWQAKQYAVARDASTASSTAWTPRPCSGSGNSARADGRTTRRAPLTERQGRPSPYPLLRAGTHQAALVRVHRGLHPVAQTQLGEHVPTWVFTVVSLTNRSAAISALDSPRATSFSTSTSRSVRVCRVCGTGSSPDGRCVAYLSSRRRVMLGAAWPPRPRRPGSPAPARWRARP